MVHIWCYRVGGPPNLWILKLNGDPKPTPLLQAESVVGPWVGPPPNGTRKIPDGHWIAYESLEAGQFDVYVRPFRSDAASGGVDNGGSQPLWARSARSCSSSIGQAR